MTTGSVHANVAGKHFPLFHRLDFFSHINKNTIQKHHLCHRLIVLWHSFVWCSFPVEAVMLCQKQDVKNHRKSTEAELGGIPENQLPLICRQTSVHSVLRQRNITIDTLHYGVDLLLLYDCKNICRMLKSPPLKSIRTPPMLQPSVLRLL